VIPGATRWGLPVPAGGWPAWVADVPYDGDLPPQAAAPIERGATCHRYAYAVLGLLDRPVPPLWSDELWAHDFAHVGLDDVEPADLVLFSADGGAFGAHVALAAGGGRLLHLCAEVGRPTLWTWADFAARERYRTVVGLVRVPVLGERAR